MQFFYTYILDNKVDNWFTSMLNSVMTKISLLNVLNPEIDI